MFRVPSSGLSLETGISELSELERYRDAAASARASSALGVAADARKSQWNVEGGFDDGIELDAVGARTSMMVDGGPKPKQFDPWAMFAAKPTPPSGGVGGEEEDGGDSGAT